MTSPNLLPSENPDQNNPNQAGWMIVSITLVWSILLFSIIFAHSWSQYPLSATQTKRLAKNLFSFARVPDRRIRQLVGTRRLVTLHIMHDKRDDMQLLVDWIKHDSLDFHNFSESEALEIRSRLLNWYSQHRRKLPWRGDPPPWQGSTVNFGRKTTKKRIRNDVCKSLHSAYSDDYGKATFPVTPYGVWVSEIMLQQTRVEAVVEYWIKWMEKFPTVHELAAADPSTVNAHWAGLGFYRRSRLLHQAAKYVVENCHGIVPNTVDELLKLPGVGRYTASAIASIAFQVSVPVVDGNVCRVLSRLRGIAQHVKANNFKDVHAWTLAEQIVSAVDDDQAGKVNQALMELGATYCSPTGTGVEEGDPLGDFYLSTRLGQAVHEVTLMKESDTGLAARSSGTSVCPLCAKDGVDEAIIAMRECLNIASLAENDVLRARACGHAALPIPPPKTAKREEVLAVVVFRKIVESETTWLLIRRPETGLLAGQWEFPATCVWTNDNLPKGKRKDMSDQIPLVSEAVRRLALDKLIASRLGEQGTALNNVRRHQIGDGPLEHVFSHVRHTMWVEYADCRERDNLPGLAHDTSDVRWMSEADMKLVGITSGVRKILAAVKQTILAVPSRKRRK